ncbi:MAG: hypothetical protein ACRDGP_08565 [Actinomycetota bacterium]
MMAEAHLHSQCLRINCRHGYAAARAGTCTPTAIDVQALKREQDRINAEVAEAESQLATDGEKLRQATKIIDLAIDLANNCAASYRKAKPEVRRMWNQAFFRTIRMRDSRIADPAYEEPFASLLGSHKGSIVDLAGRCVNRLPLLDALRRQAAG